jgi:HSP20 family protein
MTTLTRHDGSTLMSDLLTWMETLTPDPEIHIEEYADGDRHVVRADLPGIDLDKDIEVTVEGGLLRLRGKTRYGTFERVLALPSGTTAGDVSARYEDGVLVVAFPMAVAPALQRIPITRGERPVE